MSETIPPSLVLITIGSAANVSITALFTGGLLPAAVAAVALAGDELAPLALHGHRRWRAGKDWSR
jgi:TRAP-type C4-dicarboxylate transport system permease large subunit